MSGRRLHPALALALLLTGLVFILGAMAQSNQPTGPDITFNFTEEGPPRPAAEIITAGGTITTMILNGTTQNPHWKGSVGNVSGHLARQDASGYSLYAWTLSTVSGEVYVSRNGSVNWTAIDCANATHVASEESAMSHNSSALDSISNTFSPPGLHPVFSTAARQFAANECNYTVNTFVNSTLQNTSFYEILLSDGPHVVYSTIIENSSLGFDVGTYDFQLIVAENGSTSSGTSTPYYFYVELV